MLLFAATGASAQQKLTLDELEPFYATDLGEDVDKPTLELALHDIIENPLAYRIGDPDSIGPELWRSPEMAIRILRQQYAPHVEFSKQNRDALADALAQLCVNGTDDQARLAMVAHERGFGEYNPYESSEPYVRSYDLLVEIFETLTAGYTEVYWCSDCPTSVSWRAGRALSAIKNEGGPEGQEYYAKLETQWEKQVAAQERNWRGQQ